MRAEIRLLTALLIRAFLWPLVLLFRAWSLVARIVCALETWSAEVLAEHQAAQEAASLPEAGPQGYGKVIPFRRSRSA